MLIRKEIKMILRDLIGGLIGMRFWWEIKILGVKFVLVKMGDK